MTGREKRAFSAIRIYAIWIMMEPNTPPPNTIGSNYYFGELADIENVIDAAHGPLEEVLHRSAS